MAGVPSAIRFESVPGWNADSEPEYSCIRKGIKPTNGSWAAFLFGGESSIWQVTGHMIVEGEAFKVDVDASVVWGGIRDDKHNLKISLFYDDGGKRVTVAQRPRRLR